MTGGITHIRRSQPRVDHTRALSAELLASVLDYIDQPGVLCIACVSRWWRAVAIAHPHFYRVIEWAEDLASFTSESPQWGGYRRLYELLDDAAQSGARYRVLVRFVLRDDGSDGMCAAVTELVSNGTVPRLHALFPRTTALKIVVPDFLRPVIFDMLQHPAPILESLVLEFADPTWYQSDYGVDGDSNQDVTASDGEDDAGTEASSAESDRESDAQLLAHAAEYPLFLQIYLAALPLACSPSAYLVSDLAHILSQRCLACAMHASTSVFSSSLWDWLQPSTSLLFLA